jgi:hypothetical protein
VPADAITGLPWNGLLKVPPFHDRLRQMTVDRLLVARSWMASTYRPSAERLRAHHRTSIASPGNRKGNQRAAPSSSKLPATRDDVRVFSESLGSFSAAGAAGA